MHGLRPGSQRWPRHLRRITGVEDFRAVARVRLPKIIFDSIDGGAGEERTMRANRSEPDRFWLAPRQARPPKDVDCATSLFGKRLSLPLILAPCGSARIVHPEGESAVARAASEAGIPYMVPHLGGSSVEQVSNAASGAALWLQLYQFGGRAALEACLDRARVSGIDVIAPTLDNGRGLRPRDVRNGMDALLLGSPLQKMRYGLPLLSRPGWLGRFMKDGRPLSAPNVLIPGGRPMTVTDLARAAASSESYFSWDDLAWLRRRWPGKIVAKGILRADDAMRAADLGCDAIIVSNHGGRMLDGVIPSVAALPTIASALQEGFPLLLDSGIRSGVDIVRALCLGAHAVLVGRPYMFALSCGEAGVRRLLDFLAEDFVRALAVLGCSGPADCTPDLLVAPVEKDSSIENRTLFI